MSLIDPKVENSLKYIKTFINTNYPEFLEEMTELQPHKGYGNFEQSAEVVQGMRNIVHGLSDVFAGASIPENFASPNDYSQQVELFKILLNKEKLLAERVIEYYGKKELSSPAPVTALWSMSRKTLSAFEYAYELMELKTSTEIKDDTHYSLKKILTRFDKVVQQIKKRRMDGGTPRPTLEISDEYDVQDLLRGLLCISFDDVREEEWTPSYAGGSKRMDFLLKKEKCVIEVKKTRVGLADKKLGDELIIDIANYKKHADCKYLYCFIYDPDKFVKNQKGLINDLEELSTEGCGITVVISC